MFAKFCVDVKYTGSEDHSFIRAHSNMASMSLEERNDLQDRGMTKEEIDMAHFEKRYQERVSYIARKFIVIGIPNEN